MRTKDRIVTTSVRAIAAANHFRLNILTTTIHSHNTCLIPSNNKIQANIRNMTTIQVLITQHQARISSPNQRILMARIMSLHILNCVNSVPYCNTKSTYSALCNRIYQIVWLEMTRNTS